MKKNYMKPTLLVESFTTDAIMDVNGTADNVLSLNSKIDRDHYSDVMDSYIKFQASDINVLNSIDYSEFTN